MIGYVPSNHRETQPLTICEAHATIYLGPGAVGLQLLDIWCVSTNSRGLIQKFCKGGHGEGDVAAFK